MEVNILAGNEFVIYGIKKRQEVVNQIEDELRLNGVSFDIRLILTEAITNAYYHGNKRDDTKPIFIMYTYDNGVLHLEIRDCGEPNTTVTIPEELPIENILEEKGRGLYLIKCCSDKVQFMHNSLIIDKYIKC